MVRQSGQASQMLPQNYLVHWNFVLIFHYLGSIPLEQVHFNPMSVIFTHYLSLWFNDKRCLKLHPIKMKMGSQIISTAKAKTEQLANWQSPRAKLTTTRRKQQSPSGEPCYCTVPYWANDTDWQHEKQTFHSTGQGNKFLPAFVILLTLDNTSKKHDKVIFLKVFGLGFLSSY